MLSLGSYTPQLSWYSSYKVIDILRVCAKLISRTLESWEGEEAHAYGANHQTLW